MVNAAQGVNVAYDADPAAQRGTNSNSGEAGGEIVKPV